MAVMCETKNYIPTQLPLGRAKPPILFGVTGLFWGTKTLNNNRDKLSSYSLEGPSKLKWGREWDYMYVWKEDESMAHTSIAPVLYFFFE